MTANARSCYLWRAPCALVVLSEEAQERCEQIEPRRMIDDRSVER